MRITVTRERFPLKRAFTISRGSRLAAEVLTVTVTEGGVTGRGECVPYARYGETPESVAGQIAGLPAEFDRDELQSLLPPGAARNAVDCALWDLQAKRENRRVWQIAGLPAPAPAVTAYTLSLDTPQKMEEQARAHADRPLLKTKLGGGDADIARIRAVRRGAPDSRLIVDANEGWTPALYARLAPVLVELGVEMVEQPLPAGEDAALARLDRVLPVCADESCHVADDLPGLAGKYDLVNVKLDKTGGLTAALTLCAAARKAGFGVMIGCMVGTSLAMAPATLLTAEARFVDLDGPLLLAEDRPSPLRFADGRVHPPEPALWG